MHIPTFTPDLTIIAIVGICVTYGLLFGHGKLKTLAMSVYVGMVLATEFGAGLYALATKNHIGNINLATSKLILLIVPILLLPLGRKSHVKGSHAGFIATTVLAVLVAALIASAGLSQFDNTAQKAILDASNTAMELYRFKAVWLAAVPLAMLAEAFIKPKDPHH